MRRRPTCWSAIARGWTPGGKVGGAYRFNGGDNYAVSLGPIGIAGAGANTVCAWCKSVRTEKDKCLWSMGDGNGAGDNAHGPILHGASLVVSYGGLGNTITTRVDPGTWNFVCCVYDGTTQYLYENGGLIDMERRSMHLVDHPFNIGRWKAGGAYCYHFKGLIDEVMVFDRVLSARELTQIYDLQK